MSHLGGLEGIGHLTSETRKDFGDVEYAIDIFLLKGGQSGRGAIWGDSDALRRAYREGHALKLQLSNGFKIAIAIQRLSDERAEIATSGAIPGFS